jgi:RNA polymerase sigma-70 factor (ECF subfamily)
MIEKELLEEKELVERAQRDPKAFGVLYDRYYPKIYHYVLGRTANVETAMDITSTTFFKALSEIKRFHWAGISFGAWLYRIATNEIYTHYRKEKIHSRLLENLNFPLAESDPLSDVIEGENELERHQEYLNVQRNLSQLSEKYQEVISLRFFENKEIHEIAEILGKPEGTIKSLLHRGLANLRQRLERSRGSPG